MTLEEAIGHYAFDVMLKIVIAQAPALIVVLGTVIGVGFSFGILKFLGSTITKF